jgi:ribonuclease-3 family protein
MVMSKAEFNFSSPISQDEALKLHPMTLAFIGDAVQSLYARTRISLTSSSKTGILHKEVTKVVKAVAQAQVAESLLPLFDEVEADVFRRARNCHIQTSAKHADRSEYRRASGFEAVLGYLYITGNNERLFNFLEKCFEENK